MNFIDSNNNIDIKDKIYKNGIYKDGLKKTEYVNGIKHGKEIILMVWNMDIHMNMMKMKNVLK